MKAKGIVAAAIAAILFAAGCSSSMQTKAEPETIPVGNPISYEGAGWTMEVQDCWDVPALSDGQAYVMLSNDVHLFVSENPDPGRLLVTTEDRRSMLERFFVDENGDVFSNVSPSSSTLMTGEFSNEGEGEHGYEAAFWAGDALVFLAITADGADSYETNRANHQGRHRFDNHRADFLFGGSANNCRDGRTAARGNRNE